MRRTRKADRTWSAINEKSKGPLAQSNVAGDRQKKNTPFGENEWKPRFVIKLLHSPTQQKPIYDSPIVMSLYLQAGPKSIKNEH